MDAIILAGGLGTRLRSVVSDIPKCMAPINESPFLFYLIKHIEKFPLIDRVILSLGYKSEVVVAWIDKKGSFSLKFDYSIEDNPLGTGGAIKKALNYIDSEDVLVLNGDTFFGLDILAFYKRHREKQASISLALKEMNNFERYGNVVLNNENKVLCFAEKEFCSKGRINGGVYLLNRKEIDFCDSPESFSFETSYLPSAIRERDDIFGFLHSEYFIDIGIPSDFKKAQEEFNLLFK
jgi:D-glycero-alpha-D-manno-heptose 1-phosphate guanylyltransferase